MLDGRYIEILLRICTLELFFMQRFISPFFHVSLSMRRNWRWLVATAVCFVAHESNFEIEARQNIKGFSIEFETCRNIMAGMQVWKVEFLNLSKCNLISTTKLILLFISKKKLPVSPGRHEMNIFKWNQPAHFMQACACCLYCHLELTDDFLRFPRLDWLQAEKYFFACSKTHIFELCQFRNKCAMY